ncbi:guanylate cyclase [Ruegeria marisrubri]|uniref:Guanylate cyclase n=1 Tax=Ruegeria marisrubri TaxID=1685379 RepID=A0A0X3TCF8_9RHOB|nr:adenylate/guanylate cyclase domain-containing protein [Ruegeria marisrubri]KUJ73373.1 guanylate cyclase [Ruegeria marisrubri]
MARAIWRGSWTTRLRLATGLILFTFAFFHFINIGLGLLDPVWMNGMQDARQVITRSAVGTVILYGALLIHVGLALTSLARRRTLRMPFNMGLQILLGLLIPLQLIPHVVHTRLAHDLFGVNDEMSYLIVLMWPTEAVWWQSLLLLLVWIHGCIGLHLWLRLTTWWHRAAPYLIGLAVLIPAFAFAGLITEGRRMTSEFADDELRTAYIEHFNWPGEQAFATLFAVKGWGHAVFWAALALTASVYLGRKVWRRRHTVRIRYVEGPEIRSELGMTLLEMSRANGVPHTALCGGKGRCTTCRVIVEEGAELLHPPGETEARSLAAIGAPLTMRLACQIRPQHPSTVFRVFRPDGRKSRAHSSQGQERKLAVLFLDMRGFTERTVGQLPYDVVFLLNRFFDAIVPAITGAGGTVDKYLGDGLLAVFETRDAASSARAGLRAAMEVGHALERFNERLASENAPAIRIGMGLHLGNLVLGEIGAAGDAARTIVGDTVNVASRLEGQTKALGVELLVSQEILRAAEIETNRLALRKFELRGVTEPVRALPVERASQLAAHVAPLEHGSRRAP